MLLQRGLAASVAVLAVFGAWQVQAGTVEFQWHGEAKRLAECQSAKNPTFKFPMYTRGPEACTKLMGCASHGAPGKLNRVSQVEGAGEAPILEHVDCRDPSLLEAA